MESEPWPGRRAECEAKQGFALANQKEAEWRRGQSSPPHLDPFPRLNENEEPSYSLFGVREPKLTLVSPEAPVLSITLEGSGLSMTRNGDSSVTSRVTYKPPSDATKE